jgi:hypothetical protein
MKPYNQIVHRWIFALTALLSGVCFPAEAGQGPWVAAQQTPAAAVACYFVGRAFLQVNSQGEFVAGQVVGYFTDINGIGASDSLFKPSSSGPSEQTAFFTFRSDVFSLTPLPSNGDIGLYLASAGTFDIFYNYPTPSGNWSNPDTFSSGQLIAHFTRPESLSVLILQSDVANPPPYESVSTHILTEILVSSQSFTFNGQRYDLSTLVPGGATLNELFSNTGVPGVTTSSGNFPVGLAFAGNCLAVAGGDQD